MSLFNNLKGVEKDTPEQLVKRFIPGRDITYGDGSKDRIIEAIVYSNRVYVLVDQISVDGRSLSNQYKIYEALNEKGLELQKITEIDLLQNILPLFSDSKGKRVIDDFVKGMLGDSSPKKEETGMGLFDKLFGTNDTNKQIAQTSNNSNDNGLLLREQYGENAEEWCVAASQTKRLPYICYSEAEVSSVEKAMNAGDNLQGTKDVMLAAGRYMQLNEMKDAGNPLIEINKNRAKIWIDEICRRASQGSLYAQAIVYSEWPFVRNYADIQEMIFENLGDRGEEFSTNIVNEINNNNPDAMLAYACFLLFDDDEREEERKQLLLQAGKLGLVEGYVEYHYSLGYNEMWSSPEGLRIATLIALLDNCPTSYEYQTKLGVDYWFGEGFVDEPNKELGYTLLCLAAKNGDSTAVSILNSLK